MILPDGYDYESEEYIGVANEAIKATKGMSSIYSQTTAVDIYNHIVENTPAATKVILATGLESVVLDEPLSDSDTDTDEDGLRDWDEVDTKSNLIKWDTDGSIILPTFKECIDKKGEELFYVKEGLDRYFMNSNAPTEQVKGELYIKPVLPIVSDPMHVDGDGDGILDINENWDGIDERYKNINPLKADTIESLYPELTGKNSKNQKNNPVYIEIDKNNIILYVKAKFKQIHTGSETYGSFLNDPLYKAFEKNIQDGIIERWSRNKSTANTVYDGSSYDFYKGMKISVDVKFKNVSNNLFDNAIVFNMHLYSGRNNVFQYKSLWSSPKNKIVNLYQNTFTTDVTLYEMSSAAHEFGHCLGLADAYHVSYDNGDYVPLMVDSQNTINNEIYYFLIRFEMGITNFPDSGEIMSVNGSANSNNIEMMLQAFSEDNMQYYTPTWQHKLSSAIKTDKLPYYNVKNDKFYYYDRSNDNMCEIGNSNDFIKWIKENYSIDITESDLNYIAHIK